MAERRRHAIPVRRRGKVHFDALAYFKRSSHIESAQNVTLERRQTKPLGRNLEVDLHAPFATSEIGAPQGILRVDAPVLSRLRLPLEPEREVLSKSKTFIPQTVRHGKFVGSRGVFARGFASFLHTLVGRHDRATRSTTRSIA